MAPPKRLAGLLARLDALPSRDRRTLLAGLVAAAVGVQATLVLPLRDKRRMVEQAATDQDRGRDRTFEALNDAKARTLEQLRHDASALQVRLAALGMKSTPHEAIGTFVARVLRDDGAHLAAVEALPVEEVPAPADAEADAATAAASAADAAASGAAAPPRLYRHRAELRLDGPAQAIVAAVGHLESQLAPLRLERVRLTRGEDGRVAAAVVLTTISQERTWLAL